MTTSQKRPRDEHGEVVEVIEYNYERSDKLLVLGIFCWIGFVAFRYHDLSDFNDSCWFGFVVFWDNFCWFWFFVFLYHDLSDFNDTSLGRVCRVLGRFLAVQVCHVHDPREVHDLREVHDTRDAQTPFC